MHLKFSHRGRQFFFLTFVIKGRRPVLSRVVAVEKNGREEAEVEMTSLGEVVIEAWKAQHGQNAALTASARVIMPDHVHLLLIVNYDIDPHFDILDWLHHFRRAIEAKWVALAGRGAGAQPPSVVEWEDAFWLDLSFDSRQLKAIRRYIRLNPSRFLWKRRHPDCFVRHRGVKARVLDPLRQWDAVGDLTLLGSPFLFHVRLTLKKTVEEHEAAIAEIVEKARRGMVPVSGFISPGEKEALRRLKLEPRARFVKMLPYGLPPKYDPSAEDSRELAAHRLLILSGFPQSVRDDRAAFRRNCLAMNDLAAAICTRALLSE